MPFRKHALIREGVRLICNALIAELAELLLDSLREQQQLEGGGVTQPELQAESASVHSFGDLESSRGDIFAMEGPILPDEPEDFDEDFAEEDYGMTMESTGEETIADVQQRGIKHILEEEDSDEDSVVQIKKEIKQEISIDEHDVEMEEDEDDW